MSSFINTTASFALLTISALIMIVCWDSLHAQVSFCFFIGLWMANDSNAKRLMGMKKFIFCSIISILFFFIRDYIKSEYHEPFLIWNLISLVYYNSLALSFLIAYRLFPCNSKIIPWYGLAWLGFYSYELYLIHGYTYVIMSDEISYFTIFLFLGLTLIISYFYKYVNSFILRFFKV